jgi:hypothetical protein
MVLEAKESITCKEMEKAKRSILRGERTNI